MLLEKEYPATHSMSTAWYLVDEEDNVGLIDYDEEGPVPVGTPYDRGLNAMSFGEELAQSGEPYGQHIQLTPEQLSELLPAPLRPEEVSWWNSVIVKVDPEQEQAFLDECTPTEGNGHEVITLLRCISEELHLYHIDPYHLTSEAEDSYLRVPNERLQALLDKRVFVEIYPYPELDIEDEWIDEELVMKTNFDQAPYYVYKQPYLLSVPIQRITVPKHPIKLSQISPAKQSLLLRIPGKFAEMPQMQIARWYFCRMYGFLSSEHHVDGIRYYPLPLEDGTRIFVQYLSSKFGDESLEWLPISQGRWEQALLPDGTRYAYTEAEMEALEAEGRVVCPELPSL